MMLHHEIDLGVALVQVDRVSEIVFLGEVAHSCASARAMRPCFAPCQVVNKALMCCMPSSRNLGENLGAGSLASFSGEIGPEPFSRSWMDSANTQRRPVCPNAAADRAMP